ncbi:MAG: nucleotidyltransferase family protein [Terriglobales bacterium]
MPNAAQSEVNRAPGSPWIPYWTPPWSPETAALLVCARALCQTPEPGKLDADVDGARLLQEAADHSMTTMLRRWLHDAERNGAPVALPEGVREAQGFRASLEERYRAILRQGLRQTAVLVEVMELFRSAGLTALPYKGPALSAEIFGDAALRQSVDLDILLPQDEVLAACRRLAAAGFAPLRPYAPGIEKQLLRYRAEVGMIRDGILVELQWRLAPEYFSVPLDVRALAARSTLVEVAGSTLPTLCVEDDLLVLCVHGAKHHWQSLKWILDIALLIRKHPELSWTTLEQRARTTGTHRILGLGLLLAEQLLQAPIPAATRDAIRHDEVLLAAAQDILAALAPYRGPQEAEHHRLMLRLRERFIDRARYLFRLGWQPTESEWESVSLPPALHFAYHGVRLGRVLAKALRAVSP